jgi:phosphoglycolate phosphatase-like HAD superfamily hydrolase
MSTTAVATRCALRPNTSIRAVLFDLSGTLLDERYVQDGLEHLATALHERFDIDPTTTRTGLMTAFRAVSRQCAGQRFYLMRDVICRALEQLITSSGRSPTPTELIHLEAQLWTAAIPTASPSNGAIETLTRLRDAGIRTAIVSHADITVFETLLKVTGLAGLTDAEVCSDGPLVQAPPRHLPPRPAHDQCRSVRCDVRRRRRRHRHCRRQPPRDAHRPALGPPVHPRRRRQRRPRGASDVLAGGAGDAPLVRPATIPPGCTCAGLIVTCPLGDLAIAATVTLQFSGRVAADTAPGTVLVGTATVTSTAADNATANNRDADTITVAAVPGQTTTTVSQGGGVAPYRSSASPCSGSSPPRRCS